MTEWAPATEAEAAMQDALRAEDQELYFRILARTELLLPISSEAIAGRAPMGWGTWTAAGRTHVLAFTSSEAMHACLASHAGSARKVPYYELAAGWPNLEWWLAVNPGLPIEGYLPAWFISQLARGDVRLPGRSRDAPAGATRAENLGRARVPVASPAGAGRLLEGRLATPQAERPADSAAAAPPAPPPPTAPAAPAPAERPAAPAPAERSAEPVAPAQRPAPAPAGTEPAQAPDSAPDPDADSGAVAPGLGARLQAELEPVLEAGFEATLEQAGEPAADPDFQPANDLERELLDAATSGRADSFLSVLLLAKVLLPVADGADSAVRPGQEGFAWRTEKLDEQPTVVVFTSSDRLSEHVDHPVRVLAIRFVQLIRAWPDESWSLAVNPGTPVRASLPGSQIIRLASSAAEVGLSDDAGAAGESGAAAASRAATGRAAVDQPVPMQKVLAPSQVGWYLERSYDRVSGFVHREQEVVHLRSPAELVPAVGLRYEGSPFDADASEVYVLRWLAYRPSLYRIPYGGRTQAAMEAMEGWVIERPPFRGNGFAPSDSDDVIAEFKVDSVRLPHGAQLWRLAADGGSELVAMLDADGPSWRRVKES